MDAELFYVLVGSITVAAVARWRGWPVPLLVTAAALAERQLTIVVLQQLGVHFDAVAVEDP